MKQTAFWREKKRTVYALFKIFSTCICWINIWNATCRGQRCGTTTIGVVRRQRVNHAFYKVVLKRLRKRVHTDIAEDWLPHHDNAPDHIALSFREFLAKKNILALPHPPSSPDLAACDFCLFPKLNSKLKGHHFGMENKQKIVTDELHTLTENDFRYWYDQCKKTLEPLCNFPRVILRRK